MAFHVYLKKGEERRIMAGHSWVYANEVARIENKDKNGSLATVFSYDGRFIGKGYINHASKILVRIFIRDEETDDENLYFKRIKYADDCRKKLGYDNCYRMVFGEADLLPALIIDRYGDVLVMQCLSLGIDMRKDMIVKCLVKLFSPRGIYERSDVAVRKKEGLTEIKGVLYGDVPDICPIVENGVKMLVNVKEGQKTGYFLDQKENRFAARRYCAGGEILDCFCNSGGFSLNAALTAKSVIACDISALALENVVKNANENGFKNITVLQGDAFETLRTFRKEKKTFDTVILDPPAFCKTADEVKDALRGYKDVNINAMKIIKRGGYLITCSCTQHVSLPAFEKMLIEAAAESGKIVKLIEIKTQAPDHPALLCANETSYLKFIVLQIY